MDDAPINIGMRPSPPGEFVREEILNQLGLSVTRASEVLGVRRATLSDLVNGNAALSPEMALRIEKAFGIGMDTLLRMQACHDGYIMRQRSGEIDVRKFVRRQSPADPHLCSPVPSREASSRMALPIFGSSMTAILAK